jgi:RHS repeat-associated protein
MMTLRDRDLPALDAGMVNVTDKHTGFRFLPHGMKFDKKVKVRLRYKKSLIPEGFKEEDVRTYFFDEASGRWVSLVRESIDTETGEVVSETDHFTDMINAVVQVPDSPQTASFNPTQIKDIKVANPAAKVNLIEPPQANNQGDARLSYPIEVPPGRRGMQPQLAVQYSSGGGNGWMGLGWDLPMQSVSIDSRWGVPRYDADKETETYTLNGQQLTPVAHRSALVERTSEKIFHTRVEGGFQKIIRHGDSPKDYWWEVIDKNGTHSFYGGTPDTYGPDPDSVLTDYEGNIAKWALSRVQDSNGNSIDYEYVRQEDSGVGGGTGGVAGFELYPANIFYTGYEGDPGPYLVTFIRDRDLGEGRRADVAIDARLGFKKVTADLLRKVEVRYDEQMVRSYEFVYTEGAFKKTLLKSIIQYDDQGQVFNRHEFEYFDEARNENGGYHGFGASETWDTGDDNVDIGLLLNGQASAIGGTRTDSSGKHMYVGFNPNSPRKDGSVGGKVGSNKSKSRGILAFTDINGDGLPDKIFGAGTMFRPNLSGPDGITKFGPPVETALGDISREKSNMVSGGVESYISGFVGANLSKTFTESSAYLSDVNGDGIIDLVKNNMVRFGRADDPEKTRPIPLYGTDSSQTACPIGGGAVDGGELLENFEELFEEMLDQNPLHDTLRRWIAPFDGRIAISGDVMLLEDTSDERTEYETADGVRVAIQHNGSELWVSDIEATDYSPKIPEGVEAIRVNKGDRIYFRVQSHFDGAYDQVQWDPRIEYLDVPPAVDANSLNPYIYQASEDFITTGRNLLITLPATGNIHLSGDVEKAVPTSDDIRVVVLLNETEVWSQTSESELIETVSVSLDLNVTREDQLKLKIEADSPVDLSQIRWKPHLEYTSAEDMDAVYYSEGNPMITFDPPYVADVYGENNLDSPHKTWTVPLSGELKVKCSLITTADAGTGVLTVKRVNELLGKAVFDVADAVLYSSSDDTSEQTWENASKQLVFDLMITASEGDQLSFGLNTRDRSLARAISSYSVSVEYEEIEVYNDSGPDASLSPWTASQSGVFAVIPSVVSTEDSGTVILRVNGTETSFDLSQTAGTALTISVEEGDQVVFEFSTSDPGLAETISAYGVSVRYTGTYYNDNVPAAMYFPAEEGLFGQPYRGWAFAGYNGNRERANQPIIESDLKLPEFSRDQYNANRDVTDPDELDSQSSPEEATAAVFYPEPAFGRWRGYDDGTWLSSDVQSSSRLNIDYIPVPKSENHAGARAVKRLSQSVQKGVSGSFGPASGSVSTGDSKSLLDFMDMNGDRFPDVVGKNSIQYTSMTGGLESKSRPVISGIRKTETTSWNLGLAGNFPEVKSNSRGTPSKSGLQMAPLGISGGIGESEDQRNYDFIDINGDGLPDKLYDDGHAGLNLGYRFADKEEWGNFVISEGESESSNIGGSALAGHNDGYYGFGGSISISESTHKTDKAWIDINGDGLADYVQRGGGVLKVALNTGNGFVAMDYPGSVSFSKNVSTSQNGGFYFTIGIPIPFTTCYIIINPGADFSKGIGRPEVAIMDIDGDGYADHLTSDKDDSIKVRRNLIGKTNLLKTVQRPLGAVIRIDYERDGNTYQMPHSRWNMARAEVFDGVAGDGVDTLVTTYQYEDGFYHRQEREFYGYETVITEQRNAADGDSLYRSTAQSFMNRNYYEKGLLVSETVQDAKGNKYLETTNSYQLRNIDTGNILEGEFKESLTATVFPELIRTDKKFYEAQAEPGIATYQTFEYDELGNVVHFFDAADAGAEDDVESFIEYHTDLPHYIVGKASKIEVKSNGELMRQREASFEIGTGNLTQVRLSLGTGTAVHDMAYDRYGNIVSQTGPPNKNGQRYAISYTYDGEVQTYPVKVEDSFGYASSAAYDLRWGEISSTSDINGQQISYRYDSAGRAVGITGPYQQGNGRETLNFAYYPGAGIPWALTQHFDNYQQQSDPLETALFIDGLKREIQTKKDGAVGSGNASAQDAMIVSGRVIFDFAGRAVEQYYPVTESLGRQGVFNSAFDSVEPTRTSYDVMDRALITTMPDKTSIRYAYGFGTDRDGNLRFQINVTDAKGISKVSYKDVQEQITSVQEFNKGQSLWTSYEYDPMGQIVLVKDNAGNLTSVGYDLGGRRTYIDSPDMGRTEYVFDAASNMTAKITANLRAKGQAIEYDYTYNRVDGIRYPEYTENNVIYIYGGPGAEFNRAGRIISVTDESGKEERFYGPLGETVKTIKTITSETQGNSTNSAEIYTTEYTYDTYNRLRELIYPDGEVLTYSYNSGGLPESAFGKKGEHNYPYLKALTYDKFEQRVYMKQGNDTETTYIYNPMNRRLATLQAKSKGKPFMDLAYGYDLVGNILRLDNLAKVSKSNEFGGETHYTFAYDDLYRLTGSDGNLKQPDTEHTYTLSMAYDSIHNIVSKNQHHMRIGKNGDSIDEKKTTYTYQYEYASSKPHAPTHIGDRAFTYDANGNQTGWQSDLNKTERKISWDEENRIQQIEDNGHLMTYKYNDAGERVFKTGPQGETAYVNQFYSVENRENGSKHVFVGTGRIATKLVKGQEDAATDDSARKKRSSRKDTDKSDNGNGPDSNSAGGNPDPSGNANGLENGNNGKCDENPGVGCGDRDDDTVDDDKPGNTPVDKPGNKPGENPGNKPGENPGNLEEPGNKPGENPGNKPGENPGNKPGENPGNKPGENPGNDPGDTSGEYPGNDPGENPGNNPNNKPDDPGNIVFEPDVFYYHPNHLGSTSFVTDVEGDIYQHLEYFPFGESWIEEVSGRNSMPYLFTAKELDRETGLYYFGARYYDPRTSVWQSADPALNEYLPIVPVDEKAREHNAKLPGMGGIFNSSNLNLYAYCLNNPLRSIDPDGKRTYFVNGISNNNPSGPPQYAYNFKTALTERGVKDVRLFPAFNRNLHFLGLDVEGVGETLLESLNINVYSTNLANKIKEDLEKQPLAKGEQLNLIGYSGGGQVVLNAAEKLEGVAKVDNLIVIGAPVFEFDIKNIGKVTSMFAAFDPLWSAGPGCSDYAFTGRYGHTGYFNEDHIGKVADEVNKRID